MVGIACKNKVVNGGRKGGRNSRNREAHPRLKDCIKIHVSFTLDFLFFQVNLIPFKCLIHNRCLINFKMGKETEKDK